MSCEGTRLALGAYVLGALDPADRQAVDAHLGGCQRCRDEVSTLAALPGLLGRLTREEVEVGPPTLTDGPLLGALEVVRHRRQRLRVAVAAVAAVAVLAGAGAVAAVGRQPSARPAATIVAASGAVQASVAAADRGWGTELTLQLSGVRPGQRCSLVAVGRDGRREVAATWQATYAGAATVTGATSIARPDLVRLDVDTPDGRTLVSMNP